MKRIISSLTVILITSQLFAREICTNTPENEDVRYVKLLTCVELGTPLTPNARTFFIESLRETLQEKLSQLDQESEIRRQIINNPNTSVELRQMALENQKHEARRRQEIIDDYNLVRNKLNQDRSHVINGR